MGNDHLVESPELSRLDVELRDVVDQALEPHGEACAEVAHEWAERVGMWFTQVRPTRKDAASVDVAVADDEALFVQIGATHFEMFGALESSLDDLAQILRAVFAGEIEEGGSRSDAFARIGAGPRPWHVGAVSLPIPWRLRHRIRRYAAYS